MPLKFLPREVRKNKGKKGGRQDSAIKSERINRAGERASERESRRGRERTRVCGRSLFRDDRREASLFSLHRPQKGFLLLLLSLLFLLLLMLAKAMNDEG